MTQTLHHSPPLRPRIQRQMRSAVVPIILPVNRTAWSLGFLFSVPDSLGLKKLFFPSETILLVFFVSVILGRHTEVIVHGRSILIYLLSLDFYPLMLLRPHGV